MANDAKANDAKAGGQTVALDFLIAPATRADRGRPVKSFHDQPCKQVDLYRPALSRHKANDAN